MVDPDCLGVKSFVCPPNGHKNRDEIPKRISKKSGPVGQSHGVLLEELEGLFCQRSKNFMQ